MYRPVLEGQLVEPNRASTSTRQNNDSDNSDNTMPGLQQVEIARKRYLQAIEANEEARRQYAEVAARVQIFGHEDSTPTRGDREARLSLLTARRQLVRLQERHSSLVCLKDELDAFRLSRSVSTLDISGSTNATTHQPEDLTAQIQEATDSVKQLVTELEFAVLRARHRAKSQRQALDSLKQTQNSSTALPSEEQRLAALQQTRSQLTSWVEENLDRCQHGNDEDRGYVVNESDPDEPISWEQVIDQEYENYLEARRQVVSLEQRLRSELPRAPKSLGLDQSQPLAAEQNGARNDQADLVAILNLIEKAVLPLRHQENRANAHKILSDEQQSSLDVRLAQMVDRLSDESQLLQAFPMLAHSGRLKHAATVFGRMEAEHQDDISSRLQPWLFAAQAAEIASTATLDTHMKQGNEAMSSISRSLNELRLLREADR
ncbi:hypothetical protein B0A52_00490 [Exophiala mesophila]|uniref:Uncharacterized protein n=1 Tax=Exophiala mesophila TaxID=212818 RepID=A0A438NK95_EXOME|nr:hypothetical protein B0A52_00490 [Exophiala mesophila]